MCLRRAIFRVRILWRARVSKAVEEAVAVEAATVSAMAAELGRGSGDSTVQAKVQAPITLAAVAIISAAVSKMAQVTPVRPAVVAVVVAVLQARSAVRVASPQRHARTVSRSVMNIKR